MLKQKIALVAATMFLLTTIILPGAVFAAAPSSTTPESVTLAGFFDVWYNDYADDKVPATITFNGLTSGTTDQWTISGQFSSDVITKTELIGVINMKDATWDLQVDESGLTSGSDAIPLGNLDVVTTAENSGGGTPHITAPITVDHEGGTLALVAKNAISDEVLYVDPTGGSLAYGWATGDILSATLNNTADFSTKTTTSTPSDYATPVAATSILNTKVGLVTAQGIFAVGVGYELTVPGGTPAGVYTGDITYTVT